MPEDNRPFWERKRLEQMTTEEWESLCDGCGRCCMHKLEDEDTDEIAFTRVACKLLDTHSCRCTRYAQRRQYVPDCIQLTTEGARQFRWLPSTCAYRLLAEGGTLPAWHPLITGDPESVHRAGISVRGKAISELDVSLDDLEDHVVEDDDPEAGYDER